MIVYLGIDVSQKQDNSFQIDGHDYRKHTVKLSLSASHNLLNHFQANGSFYTSPENIRKLEVFQCYFLEQLLAGRNSSHTGIVLKQVQNLLIFRTSRCGYAQKSLWNFHEPLPLCTSFP